MAAANKKPAPAARWGSPDKPLAGRRLIRTLEDQLDTLRQKPCHANRDLHFDHVVVAHLLAFFNPALKSLREIEDLFQDRRLRKRFGSPRVPKSTLSDAQRVFDPQLLLPLLADLKARVKIQPHDARLDQLMRDLMAADGSFFTVAPRIAWALYSKSNTPGHKAQSQKGNVRIDVHFDILRGVPTQVALSNGRVAEQDQLAASLESGKLYLLDRGFQSYPLLGKIAAGDSDFLVRVRRSSRFEPLELRPLSAADLQAGVQSDARVRISGWRARDLRDVPLRLVEIAPYDPKGEPLRLLTNRLDLSAELIGLLYKHRWQVELFFRWLKCMAGFKHFYSESPEGMTLQVYVAIIGTLLIALETGARPSGYDYSMMSMVAAGLVTSASARTILKRRRAERARAAVWQKEYNARKKKNG